MDPPEPEITMRADTLLAPRLALSLALAVAACETVPPMEPAPDPLASPGIEHAAALAPSPAALHSVSDVLTFDDMTPVGSSRLTRNDGGVSYRVQTTGLEPGTATTLWIVILNHPEYCTATPCGLPYLFVPDVEADVNYAAGNVIGGSGRATFAGRGNVGNDSGSIMGEWFGLPENGLEDARGAEIHFIIRSHGPKIPGLVDEMIRTFNAGCGPDAMEGAPPVPEALGTHGPNTCVDVQFAVHLP
jgi:hypothetical protein